MSKYIEFSNARAPAIHPLKTASMSSHAVGTSPRVLTLHPHIYAWSTTINYLSVANLTCPVVKVKKTLPAGQPIKQLRGLKTASGREAYAPERAIAFAHPIPVSQLWDHRTFWQNPPSAASPAFQSLQKRSSPFGSKSGKLTSASKRVRRRDVKPVQNTTPPQASESCGATRRTPIAYCRGFLGIWLEVPQITV